MINEGFAMCAAQNGEKSLINSIAFIKLDDIAPSGCMVLGDVCPRVKSLHSTDQKVKLDTLYNPDNVLKPFFIKELPILFPGEEYNNMILHQDSAS